MLSEPARVQQQSHLRPGLVAVLAVALFSVIAGRTWYFHRFTAELSSELFLLYDRNRDMALSHKELLDYLHSHGVHLSSAQASAWLDKVDQDQDGFDIHETRQALELFDELPTVSAALQHITHDRSYIWDAMMLLILGVALAYVVANVHQVEGAWRSSSMANALRIHDLQSHRRRLINENRILGTQEKKLRSKMQQEQRKGEEELRDVEERRRHNRDTLQEQELHDMEDFMRQKLKELQEAHEKRMQDIVAEKEKKDQELQQWRLQAQKYMGEASTVSSQLARLQGWVKKVQALKGCSERRYIADGAEEGFCVEEDSHVNSIGGFAVDKLTFGTIDLDGLYEVDRETDGLADGHSGVYACRHVTTGERFCVKIHNIDMYCGQEDNWSRRMIINDLHAKARLPAHPRLIRYERVIETRSQVFVLTELISGEDLVTAIDNRGYPLNEDEARIIFRQICEALIFLHSEAVDVIHGDVKPDNIVVEGGAMRLHHPDVCAKLIDFGLSSFLKAEAPGAPVGDDYLAPEDLGECARQSKATDVWRVGATLYAVLLNRQPFSSHPVLAEGQWRKVIDVERLQTGAFEQPPEWLGLSAEVRELICQCLTPQPERRPTMAQVMQHPWLQR